MTALGMANRSVEPGGLALTVPSALVDAIASAVADELERRGALGQAPASPYLTVDEAGAYLRCDRQRLYDLTSAGALVPRRDGRRLLFRRETLDAYLAGASTTSEGTA